MQCDRDQCAVRVSEEVHVTLVLSLILYTGISDLLDCLAASPDGEDGYTIHVVWIIEFTLEPDVLSSYHILVGRGNYQTQICREGGSDEKVTYGNTCGGQCVMDNYVSTTSLD